MEPFTVHIAIRSVGVLPKSRDPPGTWYELSWRSSKGSIRGGSTKRKTSKELEDDWGSDSDSHIALVTKMNRTIIFTLATCSPGGSVQYSGDVELSTNKVLGNNDSTQSAIVLTVFALPTATAEVKLFMTWYKNGDPIIHPRDVISEVAHTATASPTSPRSLQQPQTPLYPLLRRTDSYISPLHPVLKMLPSSFLGLSEANLAKALSRIKSIHESELRQLTYDGGYLTASNMVIETFLKQSTFSACKDVLSVGASPDALPAILTNCGFGVEGEVDLTHSLPQWLEDTAVQICGQYDLIEDSDNLSLEEVEDHRASAYRALRMALHRYIYYKVFVAIRRPPLASGKWLKTLQKARQRDQALRERHIGQQSDPDSDLSDWGVTIPVDKNTLLPAIEQLKKLKGCSIPPFDCILAVMKAGVLLAGVLEQITEGSVGADVLFPLFTWCVSQAGLQDAVECVCSIEEFLITKPSAALLLSGEMEYHATCLSAAVSHLEGNEPDYSDSCSSDTWSDDELTLPDTSPARGSDRAWKAWQKTRRDQFIRDRANIAWLNSLKGPPWKNPKLLGRRRGWYWRHGLGSQLQLNPSAFVCFLEREYGPTELSMRLNKVSASQRILSIDLERIMTGFGDVVAAQKEQLLPPLRDLLIAFIHYRPDIGYIQGMGYIALMFILHSDTTEEAFMGFCAVIQGPVLLSFYNFDSAGMEVEFRVFDRLFAVASPSFSKHLRNLGVATRTFLFDWWMTLWVRQFNYNTVAAPLWSIYIGSGCQPHHLHAISAGILDYLGTTLMSESEETILLTLSQLKGVPLDAPSLLKRVQGTLLKITDSLYQDVVGKVKKEDPNLNRLRQFDCWHTGRYRDVDKPILDVTAVKTAEWFAENPYPNSTGEIPTLRNWAWDYSKHTMSSQWDLLLNYAEHSPYCSVLIRGVDYSEWVYSLLSNWSENDTEYIAMHSARSQGLIFTHQVTDEVRKAYANHIHIDSVLSRITSSIHTNSKGWTPASYLAVCDGPIWVANKSTTDVLAKSVAFRSIDPYIVTNVPTVVERKVSKSCSSPLRGISLPSPKGSRGSYGDTKVDELSIDVVVWCSDSAANPGRVTEIHITKTDGNTLFVIPTKVHTNINGGIANQLSPTERVRVAVPSGIPIHVTVIIKTIRQLDGSNEVIGNTAPILFTGDTKISQWYPLLSVSTSKRVGKVKVDITSDVVTVKEDRRKREEGIRRRVSEIMTLLPATVLLHVASYLTPVDIITGILHCNRHWFTTIVVAFSSIDSLKEVIGGSDPSSVVDLLLSNICHSSVLFRGLLVSANSCDDNSSKRNVALTAYKMLQSGLDLQHLLCDPVVAAALEEFLAASVPEMLEREDASPLPDDSYQSRPFYSMLSVDICRFLMEQKTCLTGIAISAGHIRNIILQDVSERCVFDTVDKLTDDLNDDVGKVLIESDIVSLILKACKSSVLSRTDLVKLIEITVKMATLIEVIDVDESTRHQLGLAVVLLCEAIPADLLVFDAPNATFKSLVLALTSLLSVPLKDRAWCMLSKFAVINNSIGDVCNALLSKLLVHEGLESNEDPHSIERVMHCVPDTVSVSVELAALMCSQNACKRDASEALMEITKLLVKEGHSRSASTGVFVRSLFESTVHQEPVEVWCSTFEQLMKICHSEGTTQKGISTLFVSLLPALVDFPFTSDADILRQILADLTVFHHQLGIEFQDITSQVMQIISKNCPSAFCTLFIEMSSKICLKQ